MKKIYGRKPVLEAIKSGQEIEQILIPFGAKGNFYNELKSTAKLRWSFMFSSHLFFYHNEEAVSKGHFDTSEKHELLNDR